MFLAGVSSAGLLVPRHHSIMLFMAFFSAFFGYFWVCRLFSQDRPLLLLGLVARALLFLGMPTLSDDIYRFLWDGALLHAGTDPYLWLPRDLSGSNSALFAALNSPDYFSVYPPLNQLFFYLAASISSSWLAQTNLLRLVLVLADTGSFLLLKKLLQRYGRDTKLAFWFFLNPLLILEVTGNVHFEGLVIFFVLLALWFWEENKPASAGLGFGLAIATKLLPLIYLPAVLIKGWRKPGFVASLAAVLVAAISMVPFLLSGALLNMQNSLDLYFQKFEFNASVYFLLREIGFLVKGYNIIGTLGPGLAMASLGGIIALALLGRIKNWPLPKILLLTLTWHLLMSTTVHPWYLLPLLPMGLLAGYFTPVVWTLTVFFTYLGYTQEGYSLPMWWIWLEYGLTAAALSIEIYLRNEKI